MSIRLLAVLAALSLLTACPQKVTAGSSSPGQELAKLMRAAKTGDRNAFEARLSTNFRKVFAAFDRVGAARPELRGATTVETIMNATRMSLMEPRKELINGDEAAVTGVHDDGSPGILKLKLEQGMWKLEPPQDLLRALGHTKETAGPAVASAEEMPQRPSLRKNGGRVAALPPDADEGARLKAAALDAFDANTAKEVAQQLHAASLKNPGDKDLGLALASVLMEKGDSGRAVAVARATAEAHPKDAETYDILAMAYMSGRSFEAAAATWKRAIELDADYAARMNLKKRADLATSLATGSDLSEVETGKPSSMPASRPAPRGGQH